MKTAAQIDLLNSVGVEMSQLDRSGLLDEMGVRRLRTGLGGSHTVVTYPPLDALKPLDAQEVVERITPCSDMSLYVHIAFCEYLCPFCHYDTEFARIGTQETETMRTYMEALSSELRFWQERLDGSTLGSLYIGGGTPTSLPEERLLNLLSEIRRLTILPAATLCIETSPLTTVAPDGDHKLRALVEEGFNRFSLGIQTFDEQLLRRTRGHGQAEAVKAMEIVSSLAANVNVDLIQDLPGQTEDNLLADLEFIKEFRPAQVTWYILRIQREASWFPRFIRNSLVLAESHESIRRRLLIRRGLERIGYMAQPGGRFVLEERYHDQFKEIRSGLETTLLGVGVSAYSHGWGYMFRNTYTQGKRQGIDDYVTRVEQQGHAIETGYEISEVERVAGLLVSGIRYGVRVPESTERTAHYLSRVHARLNDLVRSSLVEVNDEGAYRLTEWGSLIEEEICAMFYSPDVRARLADTNESVTMAEYSSPSISGSAKTV
jgi:oxygen-independent coproporphyrinogen-3 oxidase